MEKKDIVDTSALQNNNKTKAVAVWSSFREELDPVVIFPSCSDVFKTPFLPNHPVSFYIMPMLCNTVMPCILHLLLYFYCCCSCSNVIVYDGSCGGICATVVPRSRFVHFYPDQIKVIFLSVLKRSTYII